MSKLIPGMLQQALDPVYATGVGPCQFGAVRKRGTAAASLALRAFIDLCARMERSCFVLFIDLSKAFDHAIREVVTGWMSSACGMPRESKVQLLVRLGMPSETASEVVDWIDRSGGLLRQLGVPAQTVRLVSSLHDGAWFRLPRDDQLVVSVSGGRQGCKLGALIFNLIYSVALERVRKQAVVLGATLRLKVASSRPFWSAAPPARVVTELGAPFDHELFEVTYVDDEAIKIVASSPRVLCELVPVFMQAPASIFSYFGFKVNWSPGKTECFLTLRGRGSEVLRRKVSAQGGIRLLPGSGPPLLRVVSSYKHLGSVLDPSGSGAPDVPNRVQAAGAAYSPIARQVFGCNAISRAARLHLYFSLVISRLSYNVHVWGIHQASHVHQFERHLHERLEAHFLIVAGSTLGMASSPMLLCVSPSGSPRSNACSCERGCSLLPTSRATVPSTLVPCSAPASVAPPPLGRLVDRGLADHALVPWSQAAGTGRPPRAGRRVGLLHVRLPSSVACSCESRAPHYYALRLALWQAACEACLHCHLDPCLHRVP